MPKTDRPRGPDGLPIDIPEAVVLCGAIATGHVAVLLSNPDGRGFEAYLSPAEADQLAASLTARADDARRYVASN